VLGLFADASDFMSPLFSSLEMAGDYMNNSKTIVVPVKEKNKVLVSLHMIYNVNMSTNEAKLKDLANESGSNFSG